MSFYATDKLCRRLHGCGRTLILGLALTLLGGCATQGQLRQVRGDQREMRGQIADLEVSVEKLRRRVDASPAADSASGRNQKGPSPQTLQSEIAALEARLAILEGGRAPSPTPTEVTPSPPVSEPSAAPVAPPTPAPILPPKTGDAAAQEEAAVQGTAGAAGYSEALQLMRSGDCNKAIPAFREFLYRNPKSPFADNAQYWIGQCYFDIKDYNRSILALNDVLSKYPKSERVPATLLLQAFAFAELGDHVSKVDARLILQKLISEYPTSPEAERARQKLQQLGD